MLFSNIIQFVFILIITFFLIGCGGTICKGEKVVVFDYDPIFKTVDIGGAPTYFKGKNNPWTKKIIVQTKGFLLVSEQKTAGFKKVSCEDKNKKGQLCQKHVISSYYIMQSYTPEEGYKYWEDIPKEEWDSISKLEDRPAQKPNLHLKNCRPALFGSLLEIMLSVFRT